MTATFIC